MRRTSWRAATGHLFVIIVSLRASFGQDVFPRPRFIPLSHRPTGLCLTDLSGDGRLDVAAALAEAGEVCVTRSRSSAEDPLAFEDPALYPVGTSPLIVKSGDLDGSGLSDLFVVNSGSGSASILLNGGDGGFRAAKHLDVGPDPRAADLGDLNGDGKLDAVVGNIRSSDVTIFLGDGAGKLVESGRERASNNAHALGLGDFDLDGRLDIVVLLAGRFIGAVTFLRGRGDGTFEPFVKTSLEAVDNTVPRLLSLGDFDHDGAPELGVGTDEDKILYLDFRPSGLFDVALVDEIPVSRDDFLTNADFDDDGSLDLITPWDSEDGAGIRVYRGNGIGSFADPDEIALQGQPSDAELVDLDGDGILDLIAGQEEPEGIAFIRGTGAGRLGLRAVVPLGAAPRALAALDIDRDGTQEILALSSGAIHVVKSAGAEGFEHADSTDFPGRALKDFVVQDRGPAEEPLLALLDFAKEEVLVAAIGAGGSLEVKARHEIGSSPARVAGGDFDSDGRRDLAVSYVAGAPVTLILNARPDEEQGEQARIIDVPAVGKQTALTAADLNADGISDLIVGTEEAVRIIFGGLTGSFESVPGPGPGDSTDLGVGDIDGNGLVDIVIASGERLTFAYNAALEPRFEETAMGAAVLALDLRDVDGDGRLDVAAVAGNEIVLLRGLEGGGLRGAERYPVGLSPRSIVLGTFNGEGKVDCATGDFDSKGISILPGTRKPPQETFQRGDVDAGGGVNLTDAIQVLDRLFRGGGGFVCGDAADANDDGTINLADPILILGYLYRSGLKPFPPGPDDCGPDPTPDSLAQCGSPACR